MSKDVVCVKTTDSVLEAIKKLRGKNVSGAPVLDEDRIVGVFSATDVLRLIGKTEEQPSIIPFLEILENTPGDLEETIKEVSQKRIGDVVSKPAVTIGENSTLEDAALTLWKKDINRLPVVDEKGGLVGIVTRKDILSAFQRP